MADQTITPVEVSINTLPVSGISFTTVTSGSAGVLTMPPDAKCVILASPSASGMTMTINAGAGAIKYNQGDWSITGMTTGVYYPIVIESARFKAMSGTDAGKVRITVTGSGNLSVGAIQTP